MDVRSDQSLNNVKTLPNLHNSHCNYVTKCISMLGASLTNATQFGMSKREEQLTLLESIIAETRVVRKWPDVAVSDVPKLPSLPKSTHIQTPKFLARSYHSQVYTVDLLSKGQVTRAVLKLFPKDLKHRYTNEVDAYRYLQFFGVSGRGTVPQIFGVLPSINAKKLNDLLQNAIPVDVTISFPASAIVMEYIEGVRPTEANLTPDLADKILVALRDIHTARVIHGDAETRNIIIQPGTGRVAWIDFSSADINNSTVRALSEYAPVQSKLYLEIV